MKKTFIFVSCLLATSGLSAQGKKSLVDIDKGLKQTKSTATAAALIESIANTTPQTEEDVAALGRLMDKYPVQGQKALAKIRDPKLAGAIEKECARNIDKFKADKGKDWSNLPHEERMAKLNAYTASQGMMVMLGRLKNRDSLPFLKKYITPDYDGTLSYTASKAVGAIAPDDPVVFHELWKKDVKNISYNAYGPSLLKEVAQKLQEKGLSGGEKDRLRGKARVELLNGRTAEEKQLLKDIVLHHPDPELRMQAGLAMTKALMFNPSPGDVEFVLEWTKNVKDPSSGQVMTYMRDHFDSRFTPVVLNYLKDGDDYDRAKAVELAGWHKIKEALAYIKECITKDKDAHVRGNCQITYWEMTGEMLAEFNPDDAEDMEKYLNNPQMVIMHEKMDDNDPNKKKYLALKAAFAKYKAAHQR